MEDHDEIIRSLAEYHGHSEEDAFAARDLLRLSPEEVVVRFNQVAKFAKTFGLNIRSLAEFVAETGIGIEPWLDEVERLRGEHSSGRRDGDDAVS
jgi:hypothetical protein